MSTMKLFYKELQKYVELGYYFCDTFLVKRRGEDIYRGNVPSIHNPVLESYFIFSNGNISDGIPPQWDFEGFSIYGDISADNIGLKDKADNESSLLIDNKFSILDTGGIIHCPYNALNTVEFCVENFYADPVFQKVEYLYSKAFTYGYRMRMGLLGDIVFFNVLAQSGFHLYTRDISLKRISVSNDNILCMRILSNFIKRYFDKQEISFEKCHTDIVGAYHNLLKENYPAFLKLQMLRYLGQYSMTLSLCLGNYSSLFVALQIVFTHAVETYNLIPALWAVENLLNSPYADEKMINILNKKMSRFGHVSELKNDIDREWYSLFWQNHELSMNTLNYTQYEKTNIDLVIATAIICEEDEIARKELLEILDKEKDDDTLKFLCHFLVN